MLIGLIAVVVLVAGPSLAGDEKEGEAEKETSSGIVYAVLGLALAASCGFRVFVPPLVIGIGVKMGQISIPNESLQWMASWPALIMFGAATLVEVGGYFIPWLDNILDAIEVPAAAIAGTVVMASFISADPTVTWVLAAIVGGGTGLAVEAGTVIVRGASSATTGGVGNPAVSTGELAASGGLSLAAIFAPLIAALILILLLGFGIYLVVRWLRRKKKKAADAPQDSQAADSGE
jgi:uncharacterized protein DUF4126